LRTFKKGGLGRILQHYGNKIKDVEANTMKDTIVRSVQTGNIRIMNPCWFRGAADVYA
jgi:hypothetical protein